MKKRIVALAAASLLLTPGARALTTSYGVAPEFIRLTSIQVTKTANGGAIYHLEGHPEAKGFEKYAGQTFHATTSWDGATHKAEENITFPTGRIETVENCPNDPWINDTPCTNGMMSATGEQLLNQQVFQAGYPLSARRLFPESRQRLQQAYAAAKPPTPTPTPTRPYMKVQTLKPTATPIPKGMRMIGTEVQPPTPTPHP